MKLFKSHIYLALFTVFSLFITSCQDNNDPELLFEDTPTARTKQAIQKLRTALKSSENGWKVTYFTDDELLGGYTFLFNFISDEEVKMHSDFGNPDPNKLSLYDITLGSTIKLSFTTKNVLHELADGDNYPDNDLVGRGYKGDFEFLLSSYDGDDIIFRVNRDASNYLRFKKATAADWTDIEKHKTIRESFPTNHMAYKIGDKVSNFSFNPLRWFASNTDNNGTAGFGVGFTSTGVVISPAIDVNGTKYSEFTLSDDKTQLVSLDGNFTIFFLKLPFNINQEWWSNAASTTKSSPAVNTAHATAKTANTATWGETLSNWARFGNLASGRKGFSLFSFTGPGRGFTAQYNVAFQGVFGEPTQIDIVRVSEGFNWRFYRHLNPLLDLYIDNAPYTTEPTPAASPTEVKLTSTKDPNVWFIMEL
ncbi:DUF4302 domain-containing protein [Tenacibaculum sp. 190524A02b]|uniref:DUF4302 domain-containing protein n=1 Tax=Tenacibaculum vairaonense TaxID=3137860 RepID=UPI0031FA8B82